MSDMLPPPRRPGLAEPAPPKLNIPGRSKAAVLLVSLGPERAAERLQAPQGGGDRAALARDGQDPAGPDGHERGRLERARRDRHGRGLRRRGRRRLRPRGARALGRPGARPRADRPPVGDDRAPAVRVPAPLLARADLRLPAQRGAADDRARHRQPAHRARRRGALAAAARAAGRGRAAHRHDDRDQPGRHRATSRPSCARSCRTSSRTSTPPRAACESLADILNNSDRTTERNVLDSLAERRRRARRRGPDAPVHLRGHRQARRPQHPARAQGRRRRRTSALALRGVNEEVKERIFANMSERGAEMLREEMEFQPPQQRSVVEEAQGRIVGVHPPPRGVRRDHHRARRRRRGRRCSDGRGLRPRRSSSPRADIPDVERRRVAVVEAARAEADAIREAARAEGFAAGQAEARPRAVEARPRSRPPCRRSPAAERSRRARRARRPVERARSSSPSQLAEKIVAGALEVAARARARRRARRACAASSSASACTILVHPDDLDLVREAIDGARRRSSAASSTSRSRRSAASAAAARSCAPPTARSTRSCSTKLDRAREVVVAELQAHERRPRDRAPTRLARRPTCTAATAASPTSSA